MPKTLQSLPGSELVAVCNHDEASLRQAAIRFPGTAAIRHYADVVNSSDIDVVSITTHWQQHYEIAEAALEAGKHVFLEKPMAATGAQCRRLLEAAGGSAGYLMVGHICRFDPRVTLAQQAIAEGRIGRIVSMHAKRNLPKAPGQYSTGQDLSTDGRRNPRRRSDDVVHGTCAIPRLRGGTCVRTTLLIPILAGPCWNSMTPQWASLKQTGVCRKPCRP